MSQPNAIDPWLNFQNKAKATETDISGYAQTSLIDFERSAFNGVYGCVTKVGTIKTPTGYGVSWSTQLNTK